MNRTIAISIIAFASLLFSCSKDDITTPKTNNLSPENGVITSYTIDGVERQFILYRPSDLPADAPLVFVLHGFTQTAELFYNIGFNQIADTAKFAICFPQGINNAWFISSHNSADVIFLKTLAHDLQVQNTFNPNKTFATGFSMGGAMCNLLALDATEKFKAVAPVAGFAFQSIWSDKNPQYSIPYFTIHGTADQIVPISGFGRSDPSVQDIVDYWVVMNSCSTQDTVQFTENTSAYYYRNGTNGNEVWYYKISGQNHVFPGDPNARVGTDVSGFNACVEIWRFFKKW
jgi:polyhydroxybutyrate depolymerase